MNGRGTEISIAGGHLEANLKTILLKYILFYFLLVNGPLCTVRVKIDFELFLYLYSTDQQTRKNVNFPFYL